MRALLTAFAATTAAIALSWLPGSVEPVWASDDVSLPQEPQLPTRLELLGCQVTDLPPKDLSKLPEIECR